jgi:hypothetical protein
MDGSFNPTDDYFAAWSKSADIAKIPLFSTMFGRFVTPYTRPDSPRGAPPGWLVQEKISDTSGP